jgi:hypothetical protein
MNNWIAKLQNEEGLARLANSPLQLTIQSIHNTPSFDSAMSNENKPEPSTDPSTKARGELLPAAVGLLVVSILHIIGGLFYFAFIYSIYGGPDADPEGMHQTLTYAMYYGISMIYAFVLATGAFSMLRLASYTWSMTVCFLALVPLIGPCYVLAIPFGVWGIMILRRHHVRGSFRSG